MWSIVPGLIVLNEVLEETSAELKQLLPEGGQPDILIEIGSHNMHIVCMTENQSSICCLELGI